MSARADERNGSIVLEAFEILFIKRGYEKALNCRSPKYIWHSAHIPVANDGSPLGRGWRACQC
jgi:hypothetical protein